MSAWKLSPSRQGDWHVLVGPYNAAFVERLKDTVPPSAREWRAAAKVWRIASEYADAVQDMIDQAADAEHEATP